MRKGTAWLSVALLVFATTGAAAEPRRVLMLHAFGDAYSPWTDMAGSFRAELIKRGFYGRKLDLIVPVGAPAAFFMQRYRQLMFPTTISVARGDVRVGHRLDVARSPTVPLQIIAGRQPRSDPTPRTRGPSQFG